MNSKKAKLMRKVGKVARKDKKLYNSLSHQEKEILGDVYKIAIARKNQEQ